MKLFWAGAWRLVIIDDTLPFTEAGLPLFPLSAEPREIWPALLYKAWLKLSLPRCLISHTCDYRCHLHSLFTHLLGCLYPVADILYHVYGPFPRLAFYPPFPPLSYHLFPFAFPPLRSGSSNDLPLLLSTLTGWLPESVPSPAPGPSGWEFLTSITQLNAASPGDVKRAYAVACEITRVREQRCARCTLVCVCVCDVSRGLVVLMLVCIRESCDLYISGCHVHRCGISTKRVICVGLFQAANPHLS